MVVNAAGPVRSERRLGTHRINRGFIPKCVIQHLLDSPDVRLVSFVIFPRENGSITSKSSLRRSGFLPGPNEKSFNGYISHYPRV